MCSAPSRCLSLTHIGVGTVAKTWPSTRDRALSPNDTFSRYSLCSQFAVLSVSEEITGAFLRQCVSPMSRQLRAIEMLLNTCSFIQGNTIVREQIRIPCTESCLDWAFTECGIL